MGAAESTPTAAEEAAEEENLQHAKTLWEKLKSISEWPMRDRVAHLNYILYLADLLRLSPAMYREGDRVADVMAVGTTVDESHVVIGVNTRLRRKCAAYRVGDPAWSIANARNFTEKIKQKCGFLMGAFDGSVPRLVTQLKEEEGDATPAKRNRPFDTCAEQVVFEKLARDGKKLKFIYAVQKKNVTSTEPIKYEVRVVKRCENCEKAGGKASTAGGETPRLGLVVTDHPALVDAIVPIVTRRVLRFLRSKINEELPMGPSTSTGIGISSGNIRVLESVSGERYESLPFRGSNKR